MDVSGDTREEAEGKSRGCPYCGGHGMATIWHEDFRGAAVELDEGRQRLLRTVAYCVCPIGRWVMIRHQKECKDVFRRTHDLYEVIAGRVPGWVIDDPRTDPDMPPPADMTKLPDWRKLVEMFGVRARVGPIRAPRYPVPHDSVLTADREPGSDG